MQPPGPLLSPNSKKLKNLTRKKFLYFRKWNLLALRLNNFLYFLKKSFSCISGNRTFQEMELSSSKMKKFLIFPEMELSSLIFFNISGRNLQRPEKQTKKSALKKFLVSYDVFAIFTSVKHREISCEYTD